MIVLNKKFDPNQMLYLQLNPLTKEYFLFSYFCKRVKTKWREKGVFFAYLSQPNWDIIAKDDNGNKWWWQEREREREVDRQREKWLGFVLLGLGLWLSANCGKGNLETLVGHMTCTWLRTDVRFISYYITLFAATLAKEIIGHNVVAFICEVQTFLKF